MGRTKGLGIGVLLIATAWVGPWAAASHSTTAASYDFDAQGSVADGSGHGHNGTYHGNIWTDSVPGGRTTAAAIGPTFTTTDYVTIPDAAISPLAEGTVEAWIYPTKIHHGEIVDFQRDAHGLHFAVTDHDQPNNPSSFVLQARVGDEACCTDLHASTPLQINTWTHVAVTWDGSAVKFYINGILDATHAHTGSTSGTGTVYVGRISSDNSWSFKGYIDELVISDVARTSFLEDPPDAPGNPAAVAGPGAGEITLTWTAPSDDGGAPIQNYRIYRGETGGSATFLAELGTVLTYTDTGLGNGITRFYQVSAKNSAGEGGRSSEASATTFDVPSVPRTLSASAGPGAGEVTLDWQGPENDGGAPVTSFLVYRGGVLLTEVGVVGTHTDSGLGNNATSCYSVSARNLAGEGAQGNEACSTTFDVPGAPRNLTAMSGPGVGNLTLNWTAPESDGRTAVTNYRIYRGTSSGSEAFLVEVGNITTYQDSGLQNGATYYYKVRAKNLAGEGPKSEGASATTCETAVQTMPDGVRVDVCVQASV